MINGPILQDDIIILNGYACDKRASKYIYQAKVNKFKEIIQHKNAKTPRKMNKPYLNSYLHKYFIRKYYTYE